MTIISGARLLTDPAEIRKLASKIEQQVHSLKLLPVVDAFAGQPVAAFQVTKKGEGDFVFTFETLLEATPTFQAQDMELQETHPFVCVVKEAYGTILSRDTEGPVFRKKNDWFYANSTDDRYWYRMLNKVCSYWFNYSHTPMGKGDVRRFTREEYERPLPLYLYDELEIPTFEFMDFGDMGLSSDAA